MRPFVSGFFHSGKCFQRFIHVPACMKTSFLFMTKQYSAYMDLQRFVFSFLTDGHLGCLHFLAVMNYAAINIYVHVFVCTCFHYSWIFTEEGNCWTMYCFTLPSAMYEGSNFITSSATLFIICLYHSHSSGHESGIFL